MRRSLTILVFSLSILSAKGQTAEERIGAFVAAGDLQGLAGYTLQVVAVAREKEALLKDQDSILAKLQAQNEMLVGALKANREDISAIRAEIVAEREATFRALDKITAAPKFTSAKKVEAAFTGAVMGAAVKTGSPIAIGIGAGANLALQLVLNRLQ